MHSEQFNELAAALAKAQGIMTNATMNRINPHFKNKYADLASVLDSIRGPLSANGLSVAQMIEIRETGMVLRTLLMHSSGQWLASEYPLPASARPQEMGSAQTYARRYSLAALICNSADEDDDANSAEANKQRIDSKGRASKPVPHDEQTGEIIESDTAETIDLQQAQELLALIENTGGDVEVFKKFAGVKDLADILVIRYDALVKAVNDRQAKRLEKIAEELKKAAAGAEVKA